MAAASRRIEAIWEHRAGPLGGLALAVLAPAEWLYRLVIMIRNMLYDNNIWRVTSFDFPMIGVGNLMVGGSGKTPLAAELVRMLAERGRKPALLHGGYAADEPALHARWNPAVPVLVGRDRVANTRVAMAGGADVIVLDDAFQHRRLGRSLDVLLVPVEGWTERPRLLPRGPWREPPGAARRAGLIVVTRKTASAEMAADVAKQVARHSDAPIVVASILPAGWRSGGGEPIDPPGRVMAVAGLARPELFARNAEQAGAVVAARMWFPDHHEYTMQDVRRILRAADALPIATTAKDALKLERLLPADRVRVLVQLVTFESGRDSLDRAITTVLK
jgi:tetraacyldisaccharide 4'-kinase